MGSLYVNGERVARTIFFYEAVQFTTNSNIKLIAVQVTNFGHIDFSFKNNMGFILQSSHGIVSDQSWKCTWSTPNKGWIEMTFDDSSWVPALCYARNDGKFYPTLSPIKGVAPSTCWISTTTENNLLFNTIYCRKRLNR